MDQWIREYEAILRGESDASLESRRGRNLDLMWANADEYARERYDACLREKRRRTITAPTPSNTSGEEKADGL